MVSKRIVNINEYLTYRVCLYCCRGLYEKDKFLFVLLTAIKIELQNNEIKYPEFQAFLKGGGALDLSAFQTNPYKWISDIAWSNLLQVSKFAGFTDLLNSISRNEKAWQQWYESSEPEEQPLPDQYNHLSTFRKLMLIR